jgi:hypothetical protein
MLGASTRRGIAGAGGAGVGVAGSPKKAAGLIDKQLEDKLSSRQVAILSGVHGLMDARSSVTHARYDAEVDTVIARCRRAYTDRDRAARVIQSAWRCAVARLEAYNRRQVLYHYMFQAQKAAGCAILSTYRTYRRRTHFKRWQAAQLVSRQATARAELVQRRAIGTIIRAIRRFARRRILEAELMRKLRIAERERLLRCDVAAAIVQRWWKIVKYEVRYWRQRNADLARERQAEAQALRLHGAATTIQRVFRGHVGRYDARVVRTRVLEQRKRLRLSVTFATDTLRTLLLEFRARRERVALLQLQHVELCDTAQRTIRTGWLDAIERRRMKIVRRRARQVALAARRLQCWWRCVAARRELRYRRKVAQTLSMVRMRREWTRLRAAWVVQSAVRMHWARRALRRLRAGQGREKINATWLIQRVGRAYLVRQSACQERAMLSSLVLRAVASARSARDGFVVALQRQLRWLASQHVARRLHEAILREKVALWRAMRQSQREDRHATLLQATGRGFRARRADMVLFRALHEERCRVRDAAALAIQCTWRRTFAKNRVRALKDSRARDLARRRDWLELQGLLFEDRVSAIGLSEQAARLGLVRHQRDYRNTILRRFFAPFAKAAPVAAPAAAAAVDTAWRDTASDAGSDASTVDERVARMYDDSDDDERVAFVRSILSRA